MERREAASFYYKHIVNEHIQLPVEAERTAHVYHLFVVKSGFRQSLIADFDTAGIGHGIHYPFMLNEFFFAPQPTTVSQAYLPQILSLPIFAGITTEELQRVVEVVNATEPIAFSKISKAPEQV
jgi:dTDP-4-amino-4,6-dideoxygalactose transaminase